MKKKTLLQKIKFFFEYEYLTWDFCLFNISKTKKFIRLAQNMIKKNNGSYHPLVLIGHSKGFGSDQTLKYLLTSGKSNKFVTLTHVLIRAEVNE